MKEKKGKIMESYSFPVRNQIKFGRRIIIEMVRIPRVRLRSKMKGN